MRFGGSHSPALYLPLPLQTSGIPDADLSQTNSNLPRGGGEEDGFRMELVWSWYGVGVAVKRETEGLERHVPTVSRGFSLEGEISPRDRWS